jgi:predicted helicase
LLGLKAGTFLSGTSTLTPFRGFRSVSALGDENTKIVGDAFEVFVEGYLGTQQKLQADTVWLVGQLPLEVRQTLNLPNDAKGIDGVFRTRTGTLVPYQVKFRSQRAYLTFTEVAPFLGLTERATDRIIFTNSNEVADDAKNRDAMRTVRGIDFDDLTVDELRGISGWLKQQPTPIPKPRPYPYQLKVLSDIAETLARSDRAQVVMACGTGKTLVALWAVEQMKPRTVLVLVPSLTLLQQTLDEWSRHNSWGKDFTYICVCSDPTVTFKDEYDPVQLQAPRLNHPNTVFGCFKIESSKSCVELRKIDKCDCLDLGKGRRFWRRVLKEWPPQ